MVLEFISKHKTIKLNCSKTLLEGTDEIGLHAINMARLQFEIFKLCSQILFLYCYNNPRKKK